MAIFINNQIKTIKLNNFIIKIVKKNFQLIYISKI